MRAVLRWLAIGAGLALVLAGGLGWAAYRKLSGNIRTDTAAERVLAQHARERPRAQVPRARNILVLSPDGTGRPAAATDHGRGPGAAGPGRGAAAEGGPGPEAEGGPGGGADRAPAPDAAVLLHLSADHSRAAAVAVPRDLAVAAPSCRRPDGSVSPPAREPLGLAYAAGGPACAIRAFERLTGVRVDHYLVVDAAGTGTFDRVAAAVGGRPGADLRRDLQLAPGASGAPSDPGRLYGLLGVLRGLHALSAMKALHAVDGATSSITADPGLSSLPALYELAGRLRALPADRVAFRTVPTAPGGARGGGHGGGSGRGPGREVVPREPEAGRLFAALRADEPLDSGYARTGRS